MRLRFVKLQDRYPAGKLPVFLLYAFFILYLGLHAWLEEDFGFCWLRTLTGINCPTCGLTRAFLALIHGRIFQGLLYNPLMLLFSIGLVVQQSAVLFCMRGLVLDAATWERRLLLGLFAVLFILNWLYVIFWV